MEEKINEYIIRRNIAIIEILKKQIACDHVWVACGSRGYQCAHECGFCTDNPDTIRMIKESQKPA